MRALAANLITERSCSRGPTCHRGGAADFLGYSKDWVYRHWKKLGGRKIGAKGLRFSRHELERWAVSRKIQPLLDLVSYCYKCVNMKPKRKEKPYEKDCDDNV